MTLQPTTGSGKLPVAVLDANVLYSRVLSDYFVHARSRNMITLRWSSAIIDEMIMSRKKRASERFTDPAELEPRLAGLDRQRTYIERTYPGEFVEPSAEDFTPFQHLLMPDPDDRHVVATAIAARANYLCTNNIADFPDAVMAELGIRRVTPDALLNELAAARPLQMVLAHQQVIAWTPRATHRTTLDALRRAQAPSTADRMERLLTSLGDLDSRDDLAQACASAVAERDRAQAGLLPPSNERLGPGKLRASPAIPFQDRHRLDQQRGIGAQQPMASNGKIAER